MAECVASKSSSSPQTHPLSCWAGRACSGERASGRAGGCRTCLCRRTLPADIVSCCSGGDVIRLGGELTGPVTFVRASFAINYYLVLLCKFRTKISLYNNSQLTKSFRFYWHSRKSTKFQSRVLSD